MHEEWEREDHTKGRKQPLGRRSSGEGEEVEWKVFGKEKRDFLSREIREKWNEIRVESIYRNTKLDGSRAIENLSTAKEPQWIDRASIKQTEHTHTHTHITSLTNFIFQKQVKTV